MDFSSILPMLIDNNCSPDLMQMMSMFGGGNGLGNNFSKPNNFGCGNGNTTFGGGQNGANVNCQNGQCNNKTQNPNGNCNASKCNQNNSSNENCNCQAGQNAGHGGSQQNCNTPNCCGGTNCANNCGGCRQGNPLEMLMPFLQNSFCQKPPAKKPCRPDCCGKEVNYELYTILNQINN